MTLPTDTEHGVQHCYMDNIGDGWRIECICSWTSLANYRMEDTGAEFDDHLRSVGQ